MIRHARVFVLPLFAGALALPACGGDSPASSSDEAFCQEIERLDELDIEEDIASAAEILGDLAKKAPNDEVRNALELIAPIFQRLSEVDEADVTAMQEIFALMSSPEVTAASDVLDRYGSDVCGFDQAGSSDTTP